MNIATPCRELTITNMRVAKKLVHTNNPKIHGIPNKGSKTNAPKFLFKHSILII